MLEKKDFIFLEYNGEQKQINIPNNIEELKNEFFKEFKEDKNKSFNFCFTDEENIDVEIDKGNIDFPNTIDEIREKEKPIINAYISRQTSNEINYKVPENSVEKENEVTIKRANKVYESNIFEDQNKSSTESINNLSNSSEDFTQKLNSIKQMTDHNLKNDSTSLEEPSKNQLNPEKNIEEISNDKKEEIQNEIISSNNNEQKEDIISDKKEEKSIILNNETDELKKELDELKKKNEELSKNNNLYIEQNTQLKLNLEKEKENNLKNKDENEKLIKEMKEKDEIIKNKEEEINKNKELLKEEENKKKEIEKEKKN
jgi:hypothetical protein